MRITLAQISGEAFDSPRQHRSDARKQFDFFVRHGVWAAMGTEAGATEKNHDYRDALILEAEKHDFYIFASKYGEWVALNRRVLHDFDHGYDGPFLAHGPGHSGRGVAWASATARDGKLGRLTFGELHALAPHNIEKGLSNEPLWLGVADWGHTMGLGSDIVFVSGDSNDDDLKHDVFQGGPFTTIADELGKHPGTHGKNKQTGNPIDFIASYNKDKRVEGIPPYKVFDDSDLKLATDHFLLLANFEVGPLSA